MRADLFFFNTVCGGGSATYLPRYTVLTGSTARAVATRSSALCLRPLTMSRPSIFPTTKIRLPCDEGGGGDTWMRFSARYHPRRHACDEPPVLTGPTNPRSPERTKGISPMGTPLAFTGIT